MSPGASSAQSGDSSAALCPTIHLRSSVLIHLRTMPWKTTSALPTLRGTRKSGMSTPQSESSDSTILPHGHRSSDEVITPKHHTDAPRALHITSTMSASHHQHCERFTSPQACLRTLPVCAGRDRRRTSLHCGLGAGTAAPQQQNPSSPNIFLPERLPPRASEHAQPSLSP